MSDSPTVRKDPYCCVDDTVSLLHPRYRQLQVCEGAYCQGAAMRARKTIAVKGLTLGVLAGSVWLGVARDANAQSALCPSVVVPPDNVRVPIFDTSSDGQQTFVGYAPTRNTGYVSSNGLCTNDASAFSGAALASQALTELSQSTTQETTRTSGNAIVDRREVERQRCSEGFRRVDGRCEPLTPRVTEEVAAAPPAPVEQRKKAGKAKPEVVATRKVQRPAIAAVRAAPPPPPPVIVEPEARFGAWTQVIGDYERRSATGAAGISALANAQAVTQPAGILTTVPLSTSVSSRSGTVGFQAGADITARGVLVPDDGMIIGAFGGYVTSDLSLSTFSASSNSGLVGSGSSSLSAKLSGGTAGLYATYFDGPFSTDVLLKVDALTLNESFTDTLAFAPGLADFGSISGPFNTSYTNSGSTSVLSGTVAANLNYRFDLYPNFWIEPTVGAQYTNTSYGANAVALGLADGSLVMVQGGSRFGTSTLIDNKVLMTTTLTGLAYSNVLVSGGFIPGAGFAGNNILARADEGQVRGRGVLAFNFDFGQGVKSFILGEVRGGQGLFGAGGKVGVRLEW
jgi:hypothetical protein